MRISDPTSLKIEELGCTLFETRTKKPGERLYLSIKEKGIKKPLLVTPINGNSIYPKARYEIVDGSQRFRVAKDLSFQEVLALIVGDATERELQEIALLRNTLQSSLAPIRKAFYIKKLKDTYNYRNVELVSLLGVQKSYITELLYIFKLRDWAVKKLTEASGLTSRFAKFLPEEMKEQAKKK